MIDITKTDLVKVVQEAYKLSVPQGLGFLHFDQEPLTNEEAQNIVNDYKDNKNIALRLDYVNGRACKLTVFRNDDKLEIHDSWYDHTDEQLIQLLKAIEIEIPLVLPGKAHGVSCNCSECRWGRKKI